MRVVIPLTAPSIAAAAVILFFDGWNEYMFASTFVQDADKWTASVGLSSFIGECITPLSTVFSAAIVVRALVIVALAAVPLKGGGADIPDSARA